MRACCAAAVLAVASIAHAQPAAPRIGYIYPAGGRQGTEFEATVGGQSLEAVTSARISGTEVQATVLQHDKPLTPQQANRLRERLQELMERKRQSDAAGRGTATTKPAWTPEDDKTIADIRMKLAAFMRRPMNPAIAETVTLKVTVAAGAEPGPRELRLGNPAALTNPLCFCIGQLPEVSKAKPKLESPSTRGFRPRNEQEAAAPTETTITLPATANGQIMPGGVDRYRFNAHRGQRLVAAASAQALIPYLADAVPGWFQATLALYDARGKEVAYDDDYRFHPDPVLLYQIPADGEYVLQIRDAIYRGREDFVYRLSVGELPFITSIFPLGCRAGTQIAAEVKGWNLPMSTLAEDARDKHPGIFDLTVRRGDLLSNRVPFAVDDLPECLEKEPNNQPGTAQAVTLPIIINGRIGRPGDWDVFRFEGVAGDQIVAEVTARRLDSPLDSVLKLTDAGGRQLAFNDDHEDKGAGLTTHQADSYLTAKLPASGTYYVHVGDAQDKGGPEYAYRLRISAPRPDFDLRVVPSGINIRAGATAPLTVYALRKDGFSGEIKLALKDAPAGFTLSGGRVPANQDQVQLTLTVPTVLDEPYRLSLEGFATIEGQEVVRPATPADDMMQAFAYHHLVPASDLLVAVSGRWRNAVKILSKTPVRIPAGGTALVGVRAPARSFRGKLDLELVDPPEGISIQDVSMGADGVEIVLHSDRAKAAPGLKGNLIVSVFAERSLPGRPKAPARRFPVGTLPAVPFEILAEPSPAQTRAGP